MTADLRHSLANLQLLASLFESNARTSTCERETDAWNVMALRVLDAADIAEAAADDIDGVWKLPLEKAQ